MTHQRDDLLHARLDGELTPELQREVERLLASDESARQRAGELDALATSLDVLEPVDPPARVMHAVLAHVKRGASTTDADAETTTLGGVLMRTKVLWGLAAAAAIVLAILSITGFPPSMGGTEGAIGAAKRYQAGQIAASDVKLGDQGAQEFLQSDLFDKLMKDESVRKALSDPALGKALADPALSKALTNADFVKALADADFGKALTDVALGKALTNADFVKALSDPALVKALSDPGLAKALSDPALGKALSSVDLKAALQSNGLAAALKSPQFGEAMRSRSGDQ